MTASRSTIRLRSLGALAALVLLVGCAGSGTDQLARQAQETALGQGHNQVIAWLPRDAAQSPTVARARTLVALGEAKRRTEAALCSGEWVFSGEVDEAGMPAMATAPDSLGRYAAWHYRIAWNPGLPDCGNVRPQEYYQTLSAHLPEWMLVQSGTPVAVYHQGEAIFRQGDAPMMVALQD
ncbi:hypothetical protein [Thiohalobacter thiocyanaticus]|uniref:hypothetical protein n=1 Tax=Thiohalobacter thiocyanaticus TaxID=585455 RepID=UPI000BBB5C5D|nr:hypothetical protein [Thiohalobacter thiocyanaticus]